MRRARGDEQGASAVEYALLIAGIAALIVAIVFLFGTKVLNLFSNTCGAISNGAQGNISTSCS